MTTKTTTLDTNSLGLVRDNFTVVAATEKRAATITADNDLYAAHRPDGVTADLEKKVDDYRAAYVSSVLWIAGEMAIEHLTKYSTEASMDIHAQMGNSKTKLSATVNRSRDGRNPHTGETITTYGATSVKVRTSYGHKSGAIDDACSAIAAAATKAFG